MVARRAIQCHASGLLPLCLSALSYRLIRMSGSSAYGAFFSSCVGRGAVYAGENCYTLVPPPHSSVAFASAYKKHILFLRRTCCIPAFRARALCSPGVFFGNVRAHFAFPARFRPMCERTLLSRRVFWQCADALCFPGAFSTNVRTHFASPTHFRAMCGRTLLCRGAVGAGISRADWKLCCQYRGKNARGAEII